MCYKLIDMKKIYSSFLIISLYFLSIFTLIDFDKIENLIKIETTDTIIGEYDIISSENLFEVQVNEESTYWNENGLSDDSIHIEGTLISTDHATQMQTNGLWDRMFSGFFFHKESKEEIILSDESNLDFLEEGKISSYNCFIKINGTITEDVGVVDFFTDNINLGVNDFTIDLIIPENEVDIFKTNIEYYHLSFITGYTFSSMRYWYIDEDLNSIENPYFERNLGSFEIVTPSIPIIDVNPVVDKNKLIWLWFSLTIIFLMIIIGTISLIFLKKNK